MADRNATTYYRGARYQTREGSELVIPISGFNWPSVNAGVPSSIDPYTTNDAAQKWPLGTLLDFGDKRFRYFKCGATATVKNLLYRAVVPLAGHIDEVQGGGAAGDVTIAFTPNTVTTDDLALNELQDGYFYINSGTGLGVNSRILSHPAIVGGVSGVLTLIDPLSIAVAAAAKGTVLHNPFYRVVTADAAAAAMLAPAVGAAVNIVTAAYYGWLQVSGMGCAILDAATQTIGSMLMPSDATAGTLERWVPETDTANEAESMAPVAKLYVVNASAEAAIVRWMLE